MNTLTKSVLAIAASLALGVATASPITYDVNLSVGTGTATGTITTDGSIGSVSAANIVSYSILLAPNPGSQFTINESNSAIGNTANLVASLIDLVFDFSVTSYWLMQNPNVGSGVNYLCFAGTGQTCGGNSGPGISMATDAFGGSFSSASGRQVIATAHSVPEPTTWGLAALALLGASVAGRRRQA